MARKYNGFVQPQAKVVRTGPVPHLPPNPQDEPKVTKRAASASDAERSARIPVVMQAAEVPLHVVPVATRVGKKLRLGGPYVPNNASLYDNALSGFLAGVTLGRDKGASSPELIAQAVAFAEEVDSAIAPGSPLDAQNSLVLTLAQGLTANRYVVGLPASAFSVVAASIAAIYNAAAASYVPDGGGGGDVPYYQDCSAGGMIVYAGPTVVPSQVILIGTPPGNFWYTFPNVTFTTTLINQTGFSAIINDSAGGVQVGPMPHQLSCNQPGYPVSADQAYDLIVDVVDGWGVPGAEGGSFGAVYALSRLNAYYPGTFPSLPLYGAALNPLDSATYGVIRAEPYGNPAGLLAGVAVWYTATSGWQGQSDTGSACMMVPVITYPNGAWNTQMALVGGYAGPSLGGLCGDTLAGQVSSSIQLALPFNQAGYSTTRVTALCQMRITQSDTATDTVGDCYTIEQDFDVAYIGGFVTCQAVGAARSSSVIQAVGGTLNLATFTLAQSGTGVELLYDLTACSTFDAGVQVDFGFFTDRMRTT